MENIFSTQDEIYTFIEKVERLEKDIYKIGDAFGKTLNSYLSETEKNYLMSYFVDANINYKDPESFVKGIKFLREYLINIPILTVHLAFMPSFELLGRMFSYINESTTEKVPLKIKYDPSLIAGATFEYKGVFKDFSIKKQNLYSNK
ncbi:hypothetical protein COV24_00370 [candidate division WWE3 bacterium CG10_big_fil_rev_8_21_14_0_10_32_10]|uniref:ATP synthase F(1) sector subunit delta n=1 Tax=candidate division WWE3 bacterium CG10_big_fil_rev_8_21_14_0_10_32_10 TaxID=1975090 RepID=A0A2H0RBH7_UNCKA|nr:MAG: hypothetical protein COV24_00370 [candidate division WWE3 bacterium CG10_big_fil_rev_8_21_14_0_10_32_10]